MSISRSNRDRALPPAPRLPAAAVPFAAPLSVTIDFPDAVVGQVLMLESSGWAIASPSGALEAPVFGVVQASEAGTARLVLGGLFLSDGSPGARLYLDEDGGLTTSQPAHGNYRSPIAWQVSGTHALLCPWFSWWYEDHVHTPQETDACDGATEIKVYTMIRDDAEVEE